MKQLSLVAILLIAIQSFSYGQIAQYEGVVFIGATATGVSTNPNFSEGFTDHILREYEGLHSLLADYDGEKALGYEFGINLGVNVSSKMGVLLEIGASSAQYRHQIDELVNHPVTAKLGVFSYESTVNSVNVRGLMRFQLNDGFSGVYVIIGPNFGMGITGREKTYFDDGSEKLSDSEIRETSFGNDRFSDYRAVTFGLTTGIGAALYLDENIRLTVDLRRDHDFSNLYSKQRLEYLDLIEQPVSGKRMLRSTNLQVGVELILGGNK